MTTRLILIRHGQTAWNAQGRLQGHTDIALDAQGLAQAAALADALRDEGLEHVYSSDLVRAADTARALALPLGLPHELDAGLRERGFGVLEGHTHREVDERWPEWGARWRRRDPDFEPPQGESLRRFHARVVAVAQHLALRHADGCIALVSHGGVLDSLYRAATRVALDAPRSWALGNASINRLLHTDSGLTLVGWNDERHLPSAPASPPDANLRT